LLYSNVQQSGSQKMVVRRAASIKESRQSEALRLCIKKIQKINNNDSYKLVFT
jgi:hypothetical protein